MSEDIGEEGEEDNGRSCQPKDVFCKRSNMIFTPQFGPVESIYLLVYLLCRYQVSFKGKILRNIGFNICVHVLNKSRGSEMHWVGGGVKVWKRDNNPYVMCEFVCGSCYFFSLIVSLKKRGICLIYLLFFSALKRTHDCNLQ